VTNAVRNQANAGRPRGASSRKCSRIKKLEKALRDFDADFDKEL